MSVNTSAISNCTYGSAGFMLTSYQFSQDPVTTSGLGRVNTRVTIRGSGFVDQDASAAGAEAAFATKLGQILAANQTDGADFKIFSLGGVTQLQVLASNCLDGGPFARFTLRDGVGILHKFVDFEVTAFINSSQSKYNYLASAATSPDNLATVTWRGTANCTGSNLVYANILANFLASYAAPGWVVGLNRESSTDTACSLTTFTLSARQCQANLPAVDGSNQARDGSATQTAETDENGRQTTTWTYDLLCIGSATTLYNQLRAAIAGSYTIFREAMSATSIDHCRLRASITAIDSTDSSHIIYWRQSFTTQYDTAWYREFNFVGAAPVLVKQPQTAGRIRQSGQAIGMGHAIQVPGSVNNYHLRLPDVSYEQLDTLQWRTSWDYEMASQDPTSVGSSGGNTWVNLVYTLASLSRPGSPTYAIKSDGSAS